jgi:5-methylcytosine-specific restriction endonuclease McrA
MKNYKSDKPCIVCSEARDKMVTYHHIYSRKAFPEFSTAPWNLIPVCQPCHNLFHNKGDITMMDKFFSVRKWMELNGWKVFNGKLIHQD